MRYFLYNYMFVQRSARRGFTLVELLIVVAILAILAAIAIPAYSGYVRRGQLQEAFTHLADYRAKMEQYYQDNKNYGSGGVCASAASANTWNGFAPGGAKYFDFGCVPAGDHQSYVLTAGGKAGEPTLGYAFTINQNGDKTTTMYAGATVSPAASCWLVRSASSCQ